MQENLVTQGLQLMLYGMATVVVFLTLLVLATAAMSGLIARYFPEAVSSPAKTPATGRRPQAADDSELVAVITAAVQRHRQRDRR